MAARANQDMIHNKEPVSFLSFLTEYRIGGQGVKDVGPTFPTGHTWKAFKQQG